MNENFTERADSVFKSLHKIRHASFGKTFIAFQENKFNIKIETAEFDSTKHHLEYSQNELIKIDHKFVWGTDGTMPREILKTLVVIINKDTIRIPSTEYEDLFNPNLCYTDAKGEDLCYPSVFLSKDKRRLYILMFNSDGAGAYWVAWVIRDKKYLRRVVDYAD